MDIRAVAPLGISAKSPLFGRERVENGEVNKPFLTRHQPRFGYYGEGLGNALNVAGYAIMGLSGAVLLAVTLDMVLTPWQNNRTRPKDAIGKMTAFDSGKEAAITPDKKVHIWGELAGSFNAEGKAFDADGNPLGHVDANRGLYLLPTNTRIGAVVRGVERYNRIVLNNNPGGKGYFADVDAPALTFLEQGAVGLILYRHLYP